MTDLELDVRPLLRDGGKPFGVIMAVANQLKPDQHLRLLVPFRPESLFDAIASKSFSSPDIWPIRPIISTAVNVNQPKP